MICGMRNLEGFFLLQKCKEFLDTLFCCIFQETKLEKLQNHLCSQAPNLVLGFTEQTKLLTFVKQKGQLPYTGRIKSEQ